MTMDMKSLLTFARISEDVYQDTTNLPENFGWSRVDRRENKQSGFFAALYEKKQSTKGSDGIRRIISFRGTQLTDIHDLATDIGIIRRKTGHQFFDALRAFSSFRGARGKDHVRLTGHSLGGALAKLVTTNTRVGCCVFNSPGLCGMSHLGPYRPNERDDLIVNINSRFDLVSRGSGQRLGRVYTIEPHVPSLGTDIAAGALKGMRTTVTAGLVAAGGPVSVIAGGMAGAAAGAAGHALKFYVNHHRISGIIGALKHGVQPKLGKSGH